MIRELMKECAPKAQESISYGIPAYKLRRIIAVISPTKKDITFSFSRGAQFKDKYGLLKGVGKSSKHVKIKSVATANKAGAALLHQTGGEIGRQVGTGRPDVAMGLAPPRQRSPE